MAKRKRVPPGLTPKRVKLTISKVHRARVWQYQKIELDLPKDWLLVGDYLGPDSKHSKIPTQIVMQKEGGGPVFLRVKKRMAK